MASSNRSLDQSSSVGQAQLCARPLLSVITPCFNESEVIDLFYRELTMVLGTLDDIDTEIIFVDDGSTDDTLTKLNRIAQEDPRLRVYSFSRNFGHQIALTAGLDCARGDGVIMMDCDLQHPPALIPEMVDKWRAGYDIVSAIRSETKGVSRFKKLSSRSFYLILNSLSDINIPDGAADFCLLSRRVCSVLQSMRERHRFLRGMIAWSGFKRASVTYEADERAAGSSKYTVAKMVTLALDAAFSFSTAPIRLATRVGFLIAVIGFIYLAWNLIQAFWLDTAVPGWASLIGVTMILGGSQLIFIGIIGQYLARVFEELKERPMYVFKQEAATSLTVRQATQHPSAEENARPKTAGAAGGSSNSSR